MTTVRPLFPPTIDSTMLSTFRSCPQKFFRQYIQHWKPGEESVHLIAGKAYATGLEKARRAFYEEGKSDEEAMGIGLSALLAEYGSFEAPVDSAKTPERTAGALEFYFERYPLSTDGAIPLLLPSGKRAIEFSFAEPLPINHPLTGDPLLYTGRSDMVCEFAGGVFIEDDKTTSSLGATWSRQWEMRSQFTGYTWAAQQRGHKIDGVLVRGVSILKTKYDTQQAISYRTPWEIDRWFEQTCRDIKRMIQMWEEGYFDYNLDHSCAEYGGCALLNVCKSAYPEGQLETYFTRRVWDPLARQELSVEEWEKLWIPVQQ